MTKNEKLEQALIAFKVAAMELSNILDETGYELQNAPEYMEDVDDFSYDIITFVEDEISDIKNK